ncbi:Lon protease family protein [Carboxydocella sp. ULO1]|uniref:Lon protease family protein n=2 Tax=unclassified Carboxydocella TaxID=2685367 RepID=UPI0009ACE6F7|nr:ATP-binding protein [Carboxydocella sp. ULO1]GAW27758.1 ATP-dependent protease [Carboxydocella sp. ULO1]
MNQESLKLTPRQLRRPCDASKLPFRDTTEVEPVGEVLGQQRAKQALEFGLKIRRPGYNIFVAGETGTGKLTYTRKVIEGQAAQEPRPQDWCYVYNFKKPSQPRAISLPAGLGKQFVRDMEDMVNSLKKEVPKAFDSENSQKKKTLLWQQFEQESELLYQQLEKMANQKGFSLHRTSEGFVSVPLLNGEPLTEEEYNKLDPGTRRDLEKDSSYLQEKLVEMVSKLKKLEKKYQQKEKQLEGQMALLAIGHLLADLKDKYRQYHQVVEYIKGIQEDIINNLESFKEPEKDEVGEQLAFLLGAKKGEDPYEKYKVNLLVDSSEVKGAPVVYEPNPTFTNLIGRIEYQNELGVLSTDHTKIKAGALHRANGGYLILQVKDVLANPAAWEALKRVLRNGEIRIENPTDHQGVAVITTLQPEPIPVQVKVVLTGSLEYYQLLHEYDEDFPKLFKIRAEFDDELVRSEENERAMAGFIAAQCQRNDLKPFAASGVARIIEYSSRLAEHQDKLSARFNEIVEIIFEAEAWATLAGAERVEAEHVETAIKEKVYRSNLYEEKLGELLAQGVILLDTSGSKVGQINGLAVLDTGDYSFGKPSRITANTYLGEEGIINIEREVRLSGRIHDKGVMILAGYLGARYAHRVPLCLSASLCFEQNYDGVDGDSASAAELYALLSSLANVPLRQDLAVTGSVNQKGEIQPIGGINEKIEGFYYTCKARGLTGTQGVIMPVQNVPNLMLNEEVVEAVAAGRFHLYAISTIDQGLELLTGLPAAEIHQRVEAQLQKYYNIISEMGDN